MPRNRTPTALKVLAGNPGKRPIPTNEPKPEPVIPSCPSHLGRAAKTEWRRIVPELAKLGLLTRVDRAALAAYCVAWGRHVEAEFELMACGLTVTSPNGYPQQSPWLAISNRALDQVRRFAAEFGLTPAARSKVTAANADDADADFFETR